MNKTNVQDDASLKEKEIQRLINSNGRKEPIKGILSDEEVLKYAGNSKSAALIRLKNGGNDFSDKWKIHRIHIILIYVFLAIPFLIFYILGVLRGNNIFVFLFLVILLIFIDYPLYFLYIKNYSIIEPHNINNNDFNISENKKNIDFQNNSVPSLNIYRSQIDDLKSLYDVKEKIVKELIEKKFVPPQLTYDRFISSIDNCTEIFYNQADVISNMINLATEHTPKMDYEIETRINIMKTIIEKIDLLTNELVVNIGQSNSEENDKIKNLLDEMGNLIDSVKDYD